MLALAFWFICSFLIGLLAHALGRSGAVWLLFSILFTPSVGLILMAILGKKEVPRRIPEHAAAS